MSDRHSNKRYFSKKLLLLLTLTAFAVVGLFCVAGIIFDPQAPTHETYVEVKDDDWSTANSNGKKLSHWDSSYVRAEVSALTYKNLVFHPELEQKQLEDRFNELHLGNLMDQVNTGADCLLLQDGTILASGGFKSIADGGGISSDLLIINPKSRTTQKLSIMQVPRRSHTAIQIKDGRVIFFGGETEKEFSQTGAFCSGYLTNTVEQLDLQTGKTKVIGRIEMPRSAVIAEPVADLDILVVGGWNQYGIILHDTRWWPGAEIFRVPKI